MQRDSLIERLRRDAPVVAPAMLKCDFGNLHRELERLEAAGAALLQWDVMDGHFVPNLTYGPLIIAPLREFSSLVFEAHLMVSNPAAHIDAFIDAGCQGITIHAESVDDPVPLLRRIRDRGAYAGLALSPETPAESVEPALHECDLVLVMSVQPGRGGQKFIPHVLGKTRYLAERLGDRQLLAIDGGINVETAPLAVEAGVHILCAGSAIFDAPDYTEAIRRLRDSAHMRR